MRQFVLLCLLLTACAAACSPLDDAVEWTPEAVQEGVPVIHVFVDDAAEIVSKDEYLDATVVVSEPGKERLSARGRIKGRGNFTWNYPKKPYKIKFDEKQSLSGFPDNRDWVLLADYCDKSLMRTAYMCELSYAVDFPYRLRYRHVNLYVNREYRGIYVLIDQVEKSSWRVDIEDDGFIIENDNYFYNEPLSFTTDLKNYPFSFKYPDPQDGEIVLGDDNYNYIVSYMNAFEAFLYSDGFLSKDGYRDFVDLHSFAKWFLMAELTATHDPNMFYVVPARGAQLRMGPLWDAEYTLGLSYRGDPVGAWGTPGMKPDPHQKIWSRWKYFGRMFADPFFIRAVCEEWEDLKPRIPALKKKLAEVAENLSYAQKANFEKWQILDSYEGAGIICLGSWEAEVQYCADFFDERVIWMDEFLESIKWE